MRNIDWEDIQFSHPEHISALYHYQPIGEAKHKDWLKALLQEGRIRFSVPMGFNDPWDCKPCYNKSFVDDPNTLDKQIEYFSESHRNHAPHISEDERYEIIAKWRSDKDLVKNAIDTASQKISTEINNKYRIYCMGTKPDCLLTWAHYAVSHTGICLEFRTRNNVFCGAYKVKYLNEYPVLDFADDREFKNILPLITKAKVWSYENEYRLISEEKSLATSRETLHTDDGFFTIPNGALKSVIMGCQISDVDKEIVEELVSKFGNGVALKQATRVLDRYELTIV